MRLIHGESTAGKAFYGGLYDRQRKVKSPVYCFSVPGKRREEGITCQLVLSWKLKRSGMASTTDFEDISNAFGIVRLEEVAKVLSTEHPSVRPESG